jgi:predicted MFS family arabinose efflux permease
MDYRGLALIVVGVALSVFGFQQSNVWGWHNPLIEISIVAGLALLVVFYFVEKRTESPLMQVRIFRIRPFLVENMVLFITNLAFIPVFFFGSEYAQLSLGKSASEAGVILLFFFIGFVIAAQIGGRMLDRGGAKRPVVIGCVLGAVGFWLWAGAVTDLSFSAQQWYIIMAGAGMGFMLGPASTDAVNRASTLSYGEATGITQTVRNYAASMGLAILGTVLVTVMRHQVTSSLIAQGVPAGRARATASNLSQTRSGGGSVSAIPHFIRLDFAHATQTVLYIMAAVMAAAAIVAFVGLRAGRQEVPAGAQTEGVQAEAESADAPMRGAEGSAPSET